ncbi:hypothetical protein [Pseudoalteromonas sp. T1lg88]|uniref:hypothetical protein n=1 Tax=Pseudoalteromonas sp. T1lg88 TaxID=2077104 RepID=UPI000CF702C8|nr:hypothetical protein [Pseudoalteromonas sp. T1lg88]
MKEQPPEQDTKTPNRNTLLFAAIVVVVLMIVVVIALSNQQQPTEPAPVAEPKEVVIEPQEPEPELEPQPTPEPVQPETVQPEPEPVMEEPLPSLDDSDAEVSERVEQSLAASSAELLVNDDLIRRTVVFVNNLAAGRVATNHSPVTNCKSHSA